LSIRNRLVALAAVMGALVVAMPVAGASAAPANEKLAATQIPCYPYPAFCGPNGQPWLQFFGFPEFSGLPAFPGLPGFPALTR
jgi:hypothetical protein